MPADLNEARRLFAEHLANDPRRFSMDAALARVVEWAFQKGIEERARQADLDLDLGDGDARRHDPAQLAPTA